MAAGEQPRPHMAQDDWSPLQVLQIWLPLCQPLLPWQPACTNLRACDLDHLPDAMVLGLRRE